MGNYIHALNDKIKRKETLALFLLMWEKLNIITNVLDFCVTCRYKFFHQIYFLSMCPSNGKEIFLDERLFW